MSESVSNLEDAIIEVLNQEPTKPSYSAAEIYRQLGRPLSHAEPQHAIWRLKSKGAIAFTPNLNIQLVPKQI